MTSFAFNNDDVKRFGAGALSGLKDDDSNINNDIHPIFDQTRFLAANLDE